MPYTEEGEEYEDDEEMYEYLRRMGDRARQRRLRLMFGKQSMKNKKKKKQYLRKTSLKSKKRLGKHYVR